MARRRKRKADEKAPATTKGQSRKKGVAEADAEQPAGDAAAVHGRDVEAVAGSAANGAFFGCYLLSSLNPKKKGATYIGFTVNPARRLRQHNGELTSGAYRTKRMRPVEMVLVVYGFSSMVHALQFEWAWQHPTVSLAVKEAAAGIKKRAGVKGKIALLYAMLNLPKWNRLPLVVQFVGSRHVVHKLGLPPLPHHMDCVLAPLSSLRCKVDETAQDPPIQDPPTQPPATEPMDGPQGNDNSDDDTEDAAPPSSSDAMSPPDSPCSHHAPLEQPVPQPGPSGWADPLSDWDWLDHNEPDCGSGPSPIGQQEQGRAAPFAAWQRLKAPKQGPKATTENWSRQGSTSIGGTCRTAMLDTRPLVERGRQTGNGSGQDGAVPGRGEGSWGGAESVRQPDKRRAAEERDEAGGSNLGADPNRPCGIKISLLQRQLLERGRVGASTVRVASNVRQTDRIDLAGDDESQGRTIEKQSSQTVEQSRVGLEEECHPRSRGLSSLLGIELVILEDSPPPPMAKSHKESNWDGESLALTVDAHGDAHERGILADQAAGRARAEVYSKETTWMRTKKVVIVLDP